MYPRMTISPTCPGGSSRRVAGSTTRTSMPGERAPHRVQAHVDGVMSVSHRAVAVALGEAIDIADLPRAQIHHHLHRRGRADGGARAERGEIAPGAVGMLGEGDRHVGRAVIDAAALPLHEGERLGG